MRREDAKIEVLFDLEKTMAGEYLKKFTYPWAEPATRRVSKSGREYLDSQECGHSTDGLSDRADDCRRGK